MRFGVWSTMTEQGVAVLDLADWQLGLNIVLVTQPSGDVCHTESWTCLLGKSKKPSPHLFNITVEYNGNNQDTLIATSIVAGGYFLIGLISVIISVLLFKF